jgi:hypothetical protein
VFRLCFWAVRSRHPFQDGHYLGTATDFQLFTYSKFSTCCAASPISSASRVSSITATSFVNVFSCCKPAWKAFGCDPCWMKGYHALFDIVATKKVPLMIKQHFVIIFIVVVERNFQGTGITFNRTRYEGAWVWCM